MAASAATGLAITNPLVKYRALVATQQIVQDPAQLRLALHLQKLYDKLKDYEPQIEYRTRLDQISEAVKLSEHDHARATDDSPPRRSTWRWFMAGKEQRDSLALTKRFTSHESAINLSSPKGLMLHGEVGTGKSMLIDLFAECLPNRKKRRWHFNTFMLETFAKLESLRRSRTRVGGVSADGVQDYSLLWLAKDMIQTSPILFLDEFQMPDRTASKILTNLMTSFFQLGGVLVATSNRMPEELAKAAGLNFPPPKTPGAFAGWRFSRRKSSGDSIFGGHNEFVAFLEVLKARCDVWEMDGGKDYRRIESASYTTEETDGETYLQVDEARERNFKPPPYYSIEDDEATLETLDNALTTILKSKTTANEIEWKPTAVRVYGRTVKIPHTYQGISMWTFEQLCKSTLGPADYITVASTYHTIIVRGVPVLTWLMKNEARRFITLLDALYECRCKLYISAAAGPDELFFPEKKTEDEGGDAVYPETLSEVYQDATAPFRPNILTQNPNYAEPDPAPDFTHARLAGFNDTKARSEDQLEDDNPYKSASVPFGRTFGRTDHELQERGPIDPDEIRSDSSPPSHRPDFGKTSAFTGEDERFAYKRAESRLWEMCGAKWWGRESVAAPNDWHRPLPLEARRWEQQGSSTSPSSSSPSSLSSMLSPLSPLTDDGEHGISLPRTPVDGPLPSPTHSSDVRIGPSTDDASRPAESFRRPSPAPASGGEK